MKFLCEFYFEIKHIKGKENKVADDLSRKYLVAAMSICKSGLRTRYLEPSRKHDIYLQIKENFQQAKLDKKCEGYNLEEEDILVFKGILYIPNCVDLKKVIKDEIHQMPYSKHLGYRKIVTTT